MMPKLTSALAIILLMPLPAHAQSESFIVKVGGDTIAVETFTLSMTRLEGELITRGAAPRWKYQGDVVDHRINVLQTAIYIGADTAAAQTGRLAFEGDSVIAHIMTRDGTTTQRLASQRGALPLINLAFSFVELATRSLRTDSAQVPFFMVSGGQTFATTLRRVKPDSLVLVLSGVELVLKTDPSGRILSGAVPLQNVTIERASGDTRLSNAKPDYSAPAGAVYTAEDVTITAPAGHKLAGTLTLPKRRTGPVPVVVTISGSGLQDRDESIAGVAGYRPFRQIAEALAAHGIGVLRYDDRGFGASTGNAPTTTTADFADDTRAIVEYLRNRRDVAPDRLFLLGHSEGAIVAPAVAATDPRLRGIILLAAPARTGRRIIEYQNRYVVDLRTDLTAAKRDSLYHAAVASLDSIAARQPWLRYFLDYNPLDAAARVKPPVLILHGATDRQVTADQAAELAAAIRASGNQDVTVQVLPDVNHLFLRDSSGNPTNYGALPDKSLVPDVVSLITDWIDKHLK